MQNSLRAAGRKVAESRALRIVHKQNYIFLNMARRLSTSAVPFVVVMMPMRVVIVVLVPLVLVVQLVMTVAIAIFGTIVVLVLFIVLVIVLLHMVITLIMMVVAGFVVFVV